MPFTILLLIIVITTTIGILFTVSLMADDEPLLFSRNVRPGFNKFLIGNLFVCSFSALWLHQALNSEPEVLLKTVRPVTIINYETYSKRCVVYLDINKDKIIVEDLKDTDAAFEKTVIVTIYKQKYFGINFDNSFNKYRPKINKNPNLFGFNELF